MIELKNIKSKIRMMRGHQYGGTSPDGIYHSYIEPNKSITIYGTQTNHISGHKDFYKTFKIGEMAEYDSFNLHYLGKIEKIGPNSITINASRTGDKTKRLDIYEFIWHNWNFELERINNYNAEERQCI